MAASLETEHHEALLERFLRYVKVDTQSDESSESKPSTARQMDLLRLLVTELEELDCEDVTLLESGNLFASLPANLPADHPAAGKVPTIGLIAHVDTYFATSGANVKPQVIESYAGGDIEVGAGQVLRVAESPNLARCTGHTLVHTDGTTLLGADDKAGVAEIMTALAWLREHPELPHGPLRIGFTSDEEVGRGTEGFDVEAFGADYAYTLDGSDLGEIENETFCADTAVVTIEGYDVHPGYAKNKLVNALRVAAAIIEGLDEDLLPETTEGMQPYLHPYKASGDVSKVELRLLVRAFTSEELQLREDHLAQAVAHAAARFPGANVEVMIQESYRNMAYKLQQDPKVLDNAMEGVRRAGLEPRLHAIRGGTDGARLSTMGLLTPNIWAGGQDFHSVREWVSLEWMAKAVEATLEILGVWVERSA